VKICFLAPANSVHSYRWIRFFVDKGHDVHWISLYKLSIAGFDPKAFKNLSYYELDSHISPPSGPSLMPTIPHIRGIFSAVKWLKGLLKQINPDLLHAHSFGIHGLVAAMSGFHPLIATAWGSDVLVGGKSIIKRPLLRHIFKKADVITSDADHMIDEMARLGADRNKMKIIYFGIDTKKFQPAGKDEALLSKLNIAGSKTVISLRNFYPVYDIESLIRAIPLVLKSVPEAKFVIVGSGPEEENIKKLADFLAVTGFIKFTGRIPNTDLIKYLNSMDVYVSTSLSDAGIAASTAEAMACGLPVVITRSGENHKWLNDGEGGFLIPVKSPEVLSEKIINLLKNESLRKAAGAANRKTIMEKNDYDNEMTKMGKIYSKITEKDKVSV
jgi:L-malate glycosyltransferase